MHIHSAQLGKIMFSSERSVSMSPFGGANMDQHLYRSSLKPGALPHGVKIDQNQVKQG